MIHFLSFLLAVAALSLLVVFASLRGEVVDIVSYSLFGASLAGFYFVRFLLCLNPTQSKPRLARLDHVLIYLLTAATYTTVALNLPSPAWGWSIFGVVWGLALFVSALRWWSRLKAGWLTLSFYVPLLILDLVAFHTVHTFLNAEATLWFSFGAVFYITETYLVVHRPNFSLVKRFKSHENFAAPFAVLASICHFIALLTLLP